MPANRINEVFYFARNCVNIHGVPVEKLPDQTWFRRALSLVLVFVIFSEAYSEPFGSQSEDSRSVTNSVWTSHDVANQPFTRYCCESNISQGLSYFVSKPDQEGSFPLVLFVQGSGYGSLFTMRDERIVPEYGHATVVDVFGKTANVMIVEKPGVPFLFDARTRANGLGPEAFHKHFSLDSWCGAIESCLSHFAENNKFNSDRILIIGHSEGGVVVSRLAGKLKEKVSHVALLAGGGPSQLFSLVELTRKGDLLADVSDSPDERVNFVISQWNAILDSPQDTTKRFYGFSYLRWHSFLSTSPADELTNATAKIYVAQGTKDKAVSPTSARMLHLHLLSKGKDVQFDLVKGADHSFAIASNPKLDGWRAQLEKIKDWFSKQIR